MLLESTPSESNVRMNNKGGKASAAKTRFRERSKIDSNIPQKPELGIRPRSPPKEAFISKIRFTKSDSTSRKSRPKARIDAIVRQGKSRIGKEHVVKVFERKYNSIAFGISHSTRTNK